jgi:hypothetical protein
VCVVWTIEWRRHISKTTSVKKISEACVVCVGGAGEGWIGVELFVRFNSNLTKRTCYGMNRENVQKL